jgi:hypothetical protein
MKNIEKEEIAKSLSLLVTKNKSKCESTFIMSTLNDFQEIVHQLGSISIDEAVNDNELKNRFFEIVNLYLYMIADLNRVMYKRNNNKISYHILAMRIINTIKGLDNKPRSIVVNKTRVFLEKDMNVLTTLITLLSHYIFKVQSSPLLVNQSNFENDDIEEVFNSCSEIISILTIIWYNYFTSEATANKLMEEINHHRQG